MNYFTLGVLGFIVGLSGAMLPGPMSVFVISEVLHRRLRSVNLIVLGHMLTEAVMVILLLSGLKRIISSKIVFNFLSILGAVVLIFMGMHIFFRTSQMKLSINRNINFSSGLILGGIFFTAFNPTFPAWWMSVGASLLSRALLFGLLGVFILLLGHWLADLGWFLFLGFAVSKGKVWLNDRIYQLILKVLGVILAGLGFWSAFQLKTA